MSAAQFAQTVMLKNTFEAPVVALLGDLGPVISCIFYCLLPFESLIKCKMQIPSLPKKNITGLDLVEEQDRIFELGLLPKGEGQRLFRTIRLDKNTFFCPRFFFPFCRKIHGEPKKRFSVFCSPKNKKNGTEGIWCSALQRSMTGTKGIRLSALQRSTTGTSGIGGSFAEQVEGTNQAQHGWTQSPHKPDNQFAGMTCLFPCMNNWEPSPRKGSDMVLPML